MTVPANTILTVRTIDSIDSKTNHAGEVFKASLDAPIVADDRVIVPAGADAYVKVGTRISSGQTVCIIEAMKIMNEIEAEFGGVVREVNVEDSQPVEFGQVLFRVDPNG